MGDAVVTSRKGGSESRESGGFPSSAHQAARPIHEKVQDEIRDKIHKQSKGPRSLDVNSDKAEYTIG